MLVLREPQLETRQVVQLIRRLVPLLGEGLIIHANCSDGVEIASRCGTGLHLSAHMDPESVRPQITGWLGKSCHNPIDLVLARNAGCDYVTLSPVFEPLSKPGDKRATLGRDGLAALCATTEIPVMALGGMTPERVAIVAAAGAYGVASMGAIFSSESTPEETARNTSAMVEALRTSQYAVQRHT